MRSSGRKAKKKAGPRKESKRSARVSGQLRHGRPAADSVKEVIKAVSPKNVPFNILRTNENDAYDPQPHEDPGFKKKPI